jgi:preprotein translocase subunit SecA
MLNAKNHEQEAEIIAQAGKKGAVTIATNMAGRGVDIILGGNPPDEKEAEEVKSLGGLMVIGTERHEARRIDNQLRGRSGRQGDPGKSQFFVSLEDDLLRIFGGDRIKNLMERFHLPEDEPIEARLVSNAIESAQTKIEGMHFDVRKHLLDYDDVVNKHRKVFYGKRMEILVSFEKSLLRGKIIEMLQKKGFAKESYEEKEKEIGEERMRKAEKFLCLRILDSLWLEHLENMESLRDSVRLRAYGQRDPLVEYKNEGHRLFSQLLSDFETVLSNTILKMQVAERSSLEEKKHFVSAPVAKNKVGRNDPCPCGSGKKYKKCCGK